MQETRQSDAQLTAADLDAILDEISYKPGWCVLLRFDGDRPWLQVKFSDVDVDHPERGEVTQACRKWYLSPHMTRTEVVRTAYLAILQAEAHEVGEWFKWRGQPVFNPHFDVLALHELAAANRYEVREG